MLDNLKPVSSSHSISRVVAAIYVPQTFVKPKDVFKKTCSIDGFKSYQKKGLLNSRTIKINSKTIDTSEDEIKGFTFESFNDNGLVENIFKLENNTVNQSTISIENRKYKRWSEFKNELFARLKDLSDVEDFYVEATSLTYIDEFVWEGQDQIPVSTIFNNNSELLNKKFVTSRNGTLVFISQGKTENLDYEERTEITFNNDVKRILLNHQYVIKLKEIRLFSEISDELKKDFDISHNENKNILKSVLTKECQSKINLK